MESSDHKPESTNPKDVPRSETEGRFSFASSSSTSSFNSIVNTNDDMEIMEDDDDDDDDDKGGNEVGGHKTPMSPKSSSKTPGTIGTSSDDQDDQLQTTTNQTYEGYDSNRIPSAVFSRKPTNRMEWSVASNESLFSIHTGNNSFSMGPDLMLPFEVNNEAKGVNDSNAPFGLPTTAEEGVENSNNSSRMNSITSTLKEEEDHSMTRQQPAAATPLIPKKDDKNHSFEITHVPEPLSPSGGGMIPLSTGGNHGESSNYVRDSSSTGTHTSNISRGSGTSSSSFAFPLLASESGRKKRSSTAAPEQPVTAMIDGGADDEKSKLETETVPEAAGEAATTATNPTNAGEKKSSWLSYFSCFTSCPLNCKKSNQANCFSKGKEDKVDN